MVLKSRASKFLTFSAIGLLVLLGTLLRWGALGRESLWFDEGYTAWTTTQGVLRIIQAIRNDLTPPGYYLLLHFWAKAFGDSPAALHSMSALTATLSMGVFFLLARRVLRNRLGVVVAMGFFALCVMEIENTKNARFYSLMTLASLLSLWGLHRFMDFRRRGRFDAASMGLIVFGSALGLYAHNMMLFYLAMLNGLWLILPGPVSLKQRLRDILLADVLIGLVYAPWAPSFLHQLMRAKADFWIQRPTTSDLMYVLTLVAGIKGQYPAHLFNGLPMLGQDSQLSVQVLALCVVGGCLLLQFFNWRQRRSREVLALAAYAVPPILAVFVLSQYGHPLFLDRVFIASAPIFALILAAPVAQRRRLPRPARWVGGLVLCGMAYWTVLSVAGFWHYEHREDWRGMHQYVSTLDRRGELIVFVANEGQFLFEYYAKQNGQSVDRQDMVGLPIGVFDSDVPHTMARVLRDSDLDPLHKALASGRYQSVIYVRSHTWYTDPGQRVQAYLQQHFGPPREQAFWPDMLYVDEYGY